MTSISALLASPHYTSALSCTGRLVGLRDVKEGYQLYIGMSAAVHGCVCDGVQSERRNKLNRVPVQNIRDSSGLIWSTGAGVDVGLSGMMQRRMYGACLEDYTARTRRTVAGDIWESARHGLMIDYDNWNDLLPKICNSKVQSICLAPVSHLASIHLFWFRPSPHSQFYRSAVGCPASV